MSPSRVERRARARLQRRRVLLVGVPLCAFIAVIVAGAMIGRPGSERVGPAQSEQHATERAASRVAESVAPTGATRSSRTTKAPEGLEGEDYLSYAPTPASTDATPVEVPSVVGRTLADARMLLTAADLDTECQSATGDASVASQQPEAGSIVVAGSAVNLVLESGAAPKPATKTASAAKTKALPTLVVCIDPGHQSHSNMAKEPIGPGSKTLKPKVTGGATGVKTRVPEYEVALQIAMNVRARLQKSGIKVVMTRTTNDVNLSNAQRAQIANRVRASLFLRIHANGSADARKAGVSTLYPGVTAWTKSTATKSRRAATLVQRAVLASTSAVNDGTHARTDVTGFNWCKAPSILVECGYLSNPVEDRLLTSPRYQDKVAAGITAGVLRYLGR